MSPAKVLTKGNPGKTFARLFSSSSKGIKVTVRHNCAALFYVGLYQQWLQFLLLRISRISAKSLDLRENPRNSRHSHLLQKAASGERPFCTIPGAVQNGRAIWI